VNDIIQRMMQAGLIKKAQDEALWEIKHEENRKTILTKKSFNVMSLKQLAFSFYILGIGYALAIIIFVLELAIGGSVPVCQNRKVVVKKEKKNTRKKKESRMNNKRSLRIKNRLRLEFKRLYERETYLKGERTVHI